MGKDLYITDMEYLQLLQKIKEVVNKPDFKPTWYDSTTMGDKYTETNCGLCNDNFTTKDTAMFPDQFPQRKDMKYAKSEHKCPFDFRKKVGWNGCFYTCWFFKRGLTNLTKIRQLVDEQIQRGLNNEKHNGNEVIEEPQCERFKPHQERAIKESKGSFWESIYKKGCHLWKYDKCIAKICCWDGMEVVKDGKAN